MLLICSEAETVAVEIIRSIVTNKKSCSITDMNGNVSYFDFHSRMNKMHPHLLHRINP